jgi:prevent-host-death family protein
LQTAASCLTGDTIAVVQSVSVRELRNKGGEVLDRVERGERVIVTRDGRAVAELRPLPRRSVGPVELIARRKRLPAVDPDTLRRDIDDVLNPSL